MTDFEVRNCLGVVVYTTNLAELARKFVAERQDLGTLKAWTVKTIREEQLLDEPAPKAVRGLRLVKGARL